MLCKHCNVRNDDLAPICAACGRTLVTEPVTAAGNEPPSEDINTCLPQAILLAFPSLFCLLPLPVSIPAIVCSARATGCLDNGDTDGARQWAERARRWCRIALAANLGMAFILALLTLVGVPGIVTHRLRAKEAMAVSNMHAMQTAVESFKRRTNGSYPVDLDSPCTGDTTFASLLPSGMRNPFNRDDDPVVVSFDDPPDWSLVLPGQVVYIPVDCEELRGAARYKILAKGRSDPLALTLEPKE